MCFPARNAGLFMPSFLCSLFLPSFLLNRFGFSSFWGRCWFFYAIKNQWVSTLSWESSGARYPYFVGKSTRNGSLLSHSLLVKKIHECQRFKPDSVKLSGSMSDANDAEVFLSACCSALYDGYLLFCIDINPEWIGSNGLSVLVIEPLCCYQPFPPPDSGWDFHMLPCGLE